MHQVYLSDAKKGISQRKVLYYRHFSPHEQSRLFMGHPLCLEPDFAILGAGVAGLWLANLLQNQGYTVTVFDKQGIGGTQTLASQGMIHGGMKYTLSGSFTQASQTIADMPKQWRSCLCSEGDVDLSHTRILSDHFFLWSTASVTSKLATFLASKLTRGRVTPMTDRERPPLMRHKDFNGHLYKLDDLVIDTKSLMANLAHNLTIPVYLLPEHARLRQENQQAYLDLDTLTIKPSRLICCAGEGNAALLNQLGLTAPAMQRRPLKQVLVKQNFPFEFFGHCLGADPTPRLTISSHRLPHGDSVWYLGGSLAEKGAALNDDELIALARHELKSLIPWLDLDGAEWSTLPINRAEPQQPKNARPDDAFLEQTSLKNLWVAWPTKLTLVPNFKAMAQKLLDKQPIVRDSAIKRRATASELKNLLHHHCSFAELTKMPWELAFPPEEAEEDRLRRVLLNNRDEE